MHWRRTGGGTGCEDLQPILVASDSRHHSPAGAGRRAVHAAPGAPRHARPGSAPVAAQARHASANCRQDPAPHLPVVPKRQPQVPRMAGATLRSTGRALAHSDANGPPRLRPGNETIKGERPAGPTFPWLPRAHHALSTRVDTHKSIGRCPSL